MTKIFPKKNQKFELLLSLYWFDLSSSSFIRIKFKKIYNNDKFEIPMKFFYLIDIYKRVEQLATNNFKNFNLNLHDAIIK